MTPEETDPNFAVNRLKGLDFPGDYKSTAVVSGSEDVFVQPDVVEILNTNYFESAYTD